MIRWPSASGVKVTTFEAVSADVVALPQPSQQDLRTSSSRVRCLCKVDELNGRLMYVEGVAEHGQMPGRDRRGPLRLERLGVARMQLDGKLGLPRVQGLGGLCSGRADGGRGRLVPRWSSGLAESQQDLERSSNGAFGGGERCRDPEEL